MGGIMNSSQNFGRCLFTLGALASGAGLTACASSQDETIGKTKQDIIFGSDDRIEVTDIASLPSPQRDNFQKVATATAILVDQSAVSCGTSGTCTLTTGTPTFNSLPLCTDQRFSDQSALVPPVGVNDGRNCSAFLVASNVMVTSGACFAKKDPGLPFECRTTKLVFGFERSAAGTTPTTVPSDNVFSCKAILDNQTFTPDYPTFAVFTLDRDVPGRAPLAFRRNGQPKMPDGITTLAVAGHPLGLPLKLAAGTTVIDNTQDRFFRATFDAETGQGGSPVFDYQTGQVEGLFTSLSNPRFDVRTGGAPGGGDCLTYRHCDAGCDTNAEALLVSRMTFAAENIVRFGDSNFQGPGSRYQITSTGRSWIPTSTTLPVDTDGDSIPDQWETAPFTVTVNGQPVTVDLAAMGADPRHKDMFVQLDYMQRPDGVSFQLPPQAMDAMRASFEAAPVWNPDGEPGIRLHLDAGPGSKTWDPVARNWVDWPDTPTATCGSGCIRRASAIPWSKYMVPDICNEQDCATTLGKASDHMVDFSSTTFAPFGRDQIFFYGESVDQIVQTVANQANGMLDRTPGSTQWTYGASGIAMGGGFLVALGVIRPVDDATQGWTAGGNLSERANTTQHELGHWLGFYHWGLATNLSTNSHKPDYVSVMNYLFQLSPYQVLDYSRHELPPLVKTALDERVGIREPDNRGTAWLCPDRTATQSFQGPGAVMPAAFSGAIDWNCSGFGKTPPEAPEAQVSNVNIDYGNQPATDYGSNDWANIYYQAGTVLTRSGNGSLNGAVEATPDELDNIVPLPTRLAFSQLPTANFRVTRGAGSVPVTATFNGSTSRDLQGPIASYVWTFGDGSQTTTTAPTVTHTYAQAGTYVTSLLVSDAAGNQSWFPARERVHVSATASPHFFGLDDPQRPWTSTAFTPTLNTANKTEGTASLSVGSCGYRPLLSPAFKTTEIQPVASSLKLDVFVPATANLSNPNWVGAVQLYVDIPSAGLNNLFIGQVELTPLTRARFSTIEFPLSVAVQNALRGSFSGAHLTIAVNSGSCNAALLIDNVRF
jgi:V8-like Glu-specific endopeptidase